LFNFFFHQFKRHLLWKWFFGWNWNFDTWMHSQALQQHTLSTTCIHKWFFTIKRPRYYGIMVPLPFWVRSLSGHIKPQKMLNLNSKTLRDVVLCLSRGYLKIFRNNVNECWDLHHGTNMGGEVHPRSLYILIELTSCQRKKTHTHTHTQIELTSCQRKHTHTHTHTHTKVMAVGLVA
jgi:hypothetical protein